MAKPKHRIKKMDPNGVVHIYATFNNTIITITDIKGNCMVWRSSGSSGFKGTKKSTPFAAGICARKCGQDAMNLGLRSAEIWLKGPGPGRDAAVRVLKGLGLKITVIKDVTPIPHNGCRPPKKRRV